MDMPNTERRISLALIAALAVVVAVALLIQRQIQAAIAHDAAAAGLVHGSELIARLIGHQQSELDRQAGQIAHELAILPADVWSADGKRDKVLAEAAARHGLDLLALTTPLGRVVGSFRSDGNPVSETLYGATTLMDIDTAVFLVARAPRADEIVVVGRALDDGLVAQLGQLAQLDVAVILDRPFALPICVASTVACASWFSDRTLRTNWPVGALRGPTSATVPSLHLRAAEHPVASGGTLSIVLGQSLSAAGLPFARLTQASTWAVVLAGLLAAGGIAFIGLHRARPRQTSRYRDELTGLANRVLLARQLDQHCTRALATQDTLSVLMLDLDRFKLVNETLGHDAGDRVLTEVAARLKQTLRTSDLIARQGGDEFVLILPGTGDAQVAAVTAKISAVLAQPIFVDGTAVDVDASIGIAVLPDDATTPRDLLRLADAAMFAAKRRHLDQLRWSPDCETGKAGELSLLGELRSALDRDQLEIHFQPLLELPECQVVAAEALLRWRHPERGLIPPQEFIPFAESTGFMRTLTRWILGRALEACADWRAAGFRIRVGVNITPHDLFDSGFVDYVSDLLDRLGLPAHALCLELTETAFMDHPEKVIDVMHALRRLGVALAVDDFGTGYSSLAYVRELPINEIKIDRSFIAELAERPSASPIVSSAVELGRRLALTVVAEGVEDEATLDLLARMGCNLVQGYHICHPLSEEAFIGWLAQRSFAPSPVPTVRLTLAASA